MTYIIAEIGVNHDGNRHAAQYLIHAAHSVGCNAVKFQAFDAVRLNRPDLAHLQVSPEWCAPLIEEAHSLRLHAIVTICHQELVKPFNALPWDAYKVRSPDIIDSALIHALSATGKPVIVSTGGANLWDCNRAVSWARDAWERDELTLLHCVSKYPTPQAEANLGRIHALKLLGCPVGFSDHTLETDTGALAVQAGAVMIEKHVTYDRKATGPDHFMSAEPKHLNEYVRLARSIENPCANTVQYATKGPLGSVSSYQVVTIPQIGQIEGVD